MRWEKIALKKLHETSALLRHFTFLMSAEQVHEQVSEYYGKDLTQTSDLKYTACVCTSFKSKKHSEIMSKFAPDVLNRYYGCGSPIPECIEGKTVLDLGSGTGRDVFLISVLAGESGRSIGVDMTDEQLEIANASIPHHQKTFPHASPVEFRKGFIEDLKGAGIEDNSVDVVISNCVINLAPDKQKVFNEIYRVLKENGELCISDIFSDRPLSEAARNDKVLVGECLGNVLDLMTFMEVMQKAGFEEIFPVSTSRVPVSGIPPELVDPETVFFSITFSAFKLKDKECRWEGDVAIYNGGIEDHEDEFDLDLNYKFKKGEEVPVCTMLATILGARYGRYFTLKKVDPAPQKPKTRSFITTIYDVSETPTPGSTPSCCCCPGGKCC